MSLLKKAQQGRSMMSKAAAQVQNDVLFGTSTNFPRVVEVDLTSVTPNPDQPRKYFDEEELRSLADSIERMGLKQPILVKQVPGGKYIIAAGERRFRAHQLLGRDTIFAIITDGDLDEIALIENLQRADLDAMEEARAFARLLERHSYTHEELGRIVSRSQGEIARTLATLKLPEAMLQEYPAFRKSISKSILQELAFIDDADLRRQLWEEAKAGKLTIRGLRETKKNPAVAQARAQGRQAAGAPSADDVSKLLASASKSIKRTSSDVSALTRHKAVLDDQQRAAFRRLRDLLNDLVGD
ncbi:ParB/RepB/Spo0J family partition protein (plasmid) [Skermanella mucosa]|uniref:ParB/RepB/Spo0J family partition protein n=1 Tax=Skermanella mucosa TaxID=1789672 RepID=UPI00192B3CAD|nr:ParB/RepB/Spo0J family partition protein [Skermanella mucosa]UEM25377.1 ParB/RepB/Spo0J family partition protein [Skermanella mucosa]